MENQPYLLIELEDLSSLFSPLKTTSRIKYTCFNASNNYLIFGATSGGLYVFRREPCCFLQLLPSKEGAVTQVSISPNEKLIAFSTVRGIICVLEKTSHGAKHVITTVEHQNEQVTSLQWNGSNSELFVGDNTGKVSIVMVSIFPTKGMFQTPSFVLMQLDSRIVQMDFSSNMLLVSTLTKCYICDTKKEIFRQVGHKLRDGEYGACILNTQMQKDVTDLGKQYSDVSNLAHLKLFCARPGSRVWECAIDGTVISTHHFKEALAIPPRKIHFLSSQQCNNSVLTNGSFPSNEHNNYNYPEQSFNFQRLHVFMSKYIFTYKNDGLYIFDPEKGVVLLWNNQIPNIVDAKSANDVIYLWSGFDKMYALNLVSLEKLLIRLYFQKKYLELGKLCLEFKNCLISDANNYSKLYVIHDLDEKLKSTDGWLTDGLCNDLKPLISICKAKAQNQKIQNAQKLKSDIYLVGRNVHMIMEDKRLFNQKLLRPTYLNLKERSHSVSPERFQKGAPGKAHRGNSSSLPDLTNEQAALVEENESNPRNAQVGKILEICEAVQKSRSPSKNLVFNLYDNILDLGLKDDLEAIRPVAFAKHFKDDNVSLISDLLHFGLSSKFILEWFESKFNGCDLIAEKLKNCPAILRASHSDKSLELDVKLSVFVKICVSLLKEHEIIEIIREANMDCYYFSLLEILNIYWDSSLMSVSDSSLNLSDLSSLPKFLNVAYFLIKIGQVEQCCKYLHKISLTEMFYLMLKYEDSCKLSGKTIELIELQCHTLFLTFVDKISRDLMQNCNDAIQSYIINSLENINATASCVKESNCDCGFPRAILQPTIALFPDVGYWLLEKTWPKNPVRGLDICRRIPFLWKYLIYMRRNEAIASVLPLILQTGQIQELENRSSEVDVRVLETSIQFLIKLKAGNCLNCDRKIKFDGETVSWTDLGMLFVKLSGPEETLNLLKKYSKEIDSRELNQSFYQSLIFCVMMENQSRGLRRNVVNLLSGKTPRETSQISAASESIKHKIFGKCYSEKRSLREMDSNSHHWGIKVNFKENCPVCSLPLDTKALMGEAGLIAFRCAHTFHSACLQKDNLECSVCKNISSKVDKKNES